MGEDLSDQLRRGELAALEECMERYGGYAAKIISAFLNRTLPAEDLEEALSDVFLALWNSREQMTGDVKPYLAAIARNTARQKLRRYRPAAPLPEGDDLSADEPGPEQSFETAEQGALLRDAVGTLSPEEQTVFIRFYYLEQTVPEIAAVTGENISTLKSRLKRGREKLRQRLTERGFCYE